MANTPGKRLAEFRKSLNLSQRAFADVVGVSPGRIGSMETDSAKLSRSFLQKISDTYSISSEWLLNGRGDMVADSEAHPVPVRHIDPLILMLCARAMRQEYDSAGLKLESDLLLSESTWAYNEVMKRMTDITDGDELEVVLPQIRLLLRRKLGAKK